jgi:hypothetical protein
VHQSPAAPPHFPHHHWCDHGRIDRHRVMYCS